MVLIGCAPAILGSAMQPATLRNKRREIIHFKPVLGVRGVTSSLAN